MRALAFALTALLAPAAAPAATPKAEGLCNRGETVMFACATPKGLAYVCDAKGALQYRFGQPGRLSFSWPPSPAQPAGRFHFSSTAYSGGGEAHLIFDNGGYRYVIYDRTVAGDWNKDGTRPHTFSTGVLVMKDGRRLSNLACTRPDDTIRAGAYDLPREDFDQDIVP